MKSLAVYRKQKPSMPVAYVWWITCQVTNMWAFFWFGVNDRTVGEIYPFLKPLHDKHFEQIKLMTSKYSLLWKAVRERSTIIIWQNTNRITLPRRHENVLRWQTALHWQHFIGYRYQQLLSFLRYGAAGWPADGRCNKAQHRKVLIDRRPCSTGGDFVVRNEATTTVSRALDCQKSPMRCWNGLEPSCGPSSETA